MIKDYNSLRKHSKIKLISGDSFYADDIVKNDKIVKCFRCKKECRDKYSNKTSMLTLGSIVSQKKVKHQKAAFANITWVNLCHYCQDDLIKFLIHKEIKKKKLKLKLKKI